MLCLGLTAPVFAAAPTTLDLAKKAKTLEEKRSYVQQAIADPSLSQLPETYMVAGNIELDAFDNGYKTKLINPNDPSAKGSVLADELLAAYNYYLKVLDMEQDQPKPKYSKDAIKKISGHASDFFTAGADYYNEQAFYPQAFNAFMIYGDLPSGVLEREAANFDPLQIATSYFNAGLAANQGGNYDASAQAFKKSRLAGYDKPEAAIYEIACWQTIAQKEENRASEAQKQIKDAAQFGIDKFGIQEPIFINNLVNSMVNDGEMDQAVEMVSDLIAQNPEVANLYGLRGYIYDRQEKDDLSEADYRKASSLPSADFETIKNTANKLYRIGANKLNALEGSAADTNAARQDIKVNYFIAAQDLAYKANDMQPGDSYIQNLLDSIEYALTTFFN